ncbi:MAG: hypothetical protein H0U10_12000 [Chloroflexia bacterium]|nr:hypothetical protein [Chloroflexia bacterium]
MPRPGPKISWPLANEMVVVRCIRGRPFAGEAADGAPTRAERPEAASCDRPATGPELAWNQPGEVTASVRADEPSRAANFIRILLERPSLGAILEVVLGDAVQPVIPASSPSMRSL